MTECNHPRKKVKIIETASDIEIGNTPTRYWTIHGECKCGERVEIDYEFSEIIE